MPGEFVLAGIKPGTLIAGVLGALFTVPYEAPWHHKLLAVASGLCVSYYATPLAMHYLGLPADTENSVAFVVGMVGVNLVRGVIKYSQRLRDNPGALFKVLRDRRHDDDDRRGGR